MNRRTALLASVLALLVVVPTVLALVHTISSDQEVSTTLLTIPVLALTAVTAFYIVPRRAALLVQNHEREGTFDLGFALYPTPNPDNVPQIPRHMMIKIEIVVINVGGRKAVVSNMMATLLNEAGEEVSLPETPVALGVQESVSVSRSNGLQQVFESTFRAPPYVLEPDDVIALIFKAGRGIDWEVRWDLAALRRFYDDLAVPITHARITTTWRRGQELRREDTTIPINVLQQEEYRQAIRALTDDFTVRPVVDVMPVIE